MNDRFKFRAWIKAENRMATVKSIDLFSCFVSASGGAVETLSKGDNCVVYRDESEIELMQCTGLKDSTETLIYEGDILKHKWCCGYDQYLETISVVKWCDKTAMFICDDTKRSDFPTSLHINAPKGDLKIVGNIYEIPNYTGGRVE